MDLLKSPYSDLVTYLGYYTRNGRVIGFFLKKYEETLFERIRRGGHVDNGSLFSDIRSRLNYLHTTGYDHNVIHLNNSMFDKDATAVFIDIVVVFV